jgi:hypothetical protein
MPFAVDAWQLVFHTAERGIIVYLTVPTISFVWHFTSPIADGTVITRGK